MPLATPRLPPLPDPPIIETTLLESPWPAIALVVGLGVVGFFVARRTGRTSLGWSSLGLAAALTLGLFAIAQLVRTPRERIARETRDLVDAVARVDVDAVRGQLTDDVLLYSRFATAGEPLDRILGRMRSTLGSQFPLRDYRVQEVHVVERSPNVYTARVRVTATPEGFFPTASIWDLHWRTGPDYDLVFRLELLWVQGG